LLVLFSTPALPEFLQSTTIGGLRIGDASVDLWLVRNQEQVGVNVLRKEGSVEVVVLK
jgi:hypothetical protein